MEGGAVRRTVTVLLLYALGACIVLPLGAWLRRVLVLPSIFAELLRWGVYGGAVVAALVAWFYPRIATQERGP